MILNHGCIEHITQPVEIRILFATTTIPISIDLLLGIAFSSSGICFGQVKQFHIFCRVRYHIVHTSRVVDTYISMISNVCLAITSRPLFRRYKNNPIGGTSTINSSRRSIFQYRNTFNHARIQVRDTTRNSIYQNQRIRTCIRESSLTANTKSSSLSTRGS